ncbi:MAG: LysM peptidoglycan-binding domain-containing protein [Limisphaerales bacterium]
MNAPTPLIRNGLRPLRRKPTFFFKVMVILTIHVVVIGGLLLQGCKNTSSEDVSLAPTPLDTTAPAVVAKSDQKPPTTTPQQTQVNPVPPQPVAVAVVAPPPAQVDTAVYTVKPGDTLAKIAKLHHTSSRRIQALNDLKTSLIRIGQKLKLPDSTAA